MKIYRVFAQCVNKVPGTAITELTNEDLNNEITEATNEYFNQNDMSFLLDEDGEISDDNFDKAWNAISELFTELWDKNRFLNLGDYYVTESEERPERGNMGSFEVFSKEEILNKMRAEG